MMVHSLGEEDVLEKEMATLSSILPWEIPMNRGTWRATVHRVTQSWIQLSDLAYMHARAKPPVLA